MFSSIFFLFLSILLIAIAPEMPAATLIHNPIQAFLGGLALFFFADFLVYLFARCLSGSRQGKLLIVNLFLIVVIGFYHYGLGAYRITSFVNTDLFSAFICMVFFYSGLWTFHTFQSRPPSPKIGWLEIRMLIPIALPYFILSPLLNYLQSDIFSPLATSIISIVLIVALITVSPKLTSYIWGGKPIDNPELMERLNAICARANFRHGGIFSWPIMSGAYTAAILGVVPRYRYIMFTDKVLEEFPPEEIEAILAHEIGHSIHRHLLFYPLIMFGLVSALGLFIFFVVDPLFDYTGLEPYLVHSEIARMLFAFSLFAVFAIFLWAYFRIIFGFYSRLFEREADLNVFDIGLPPENMAIALNHLAVATGYTHHNPSWHHDSLQNRIDFIHAAIKDPSLVAKHHRKVNFYKVIFLIVFISSMIFLYLL